MQVRKALGRGLDSLIPVAETPVLPTELPKRADSVKTVPIDSVVPNRFQPRKSFHDETLEELAQSIREQGIIQPLIVTAAAGNKYELIAGERRLRASKLAGLTEVPVVVKNVDTEGMLELSIIENIQREDLNPIDEANSYKELMEQFDYTQEDISERLGKSRSAVANALRLLNLPKVVQDDVAEGRISSGHARALLGVTDIQELLKLREKVLKSTLTVRDVEKMAQGLANRIPSPKKRGPQLSPQMKHLVDEMTTSLATKVILEPDREKKGGRVIIEYYSPQDLDRVYNKIIR